MKMWTAIIKNSLTNPNENNPRRNRTIYFHGSTGHGHFTAYYSTCNLLIMEKIIPPVHILTYSDIQEILGLDTFNVYYDWLRNGHLMASKITFNDMLCDTADHVMEFITENKLDIQLIKQ